MKKLLPVAITLFIVQTFISGCAVNPQITDRTIARIYADEKDRPKAYPVIFVPGSFGTILQDGKTGKVLWGAGFVEGLALPIDKEKISDNTDEVVPATALMEFSLMGGLVKKGIYENTRRIAIDMAGYKVDKTAFTLSYDWRRDLVEAAQRLGELIIKIKNESGQPGLKVDIVCHSAGGLVARYYAKYGMEDVLDKDPIPPPTYAGAGNINKIIMLGTPNRGSMESFGDINNGLTIPGIGYAAKDIIFTMPSAYEMMPFEGDISFMDHLGGDLPISLYDPANWEKYGWSVFSSDTKASEETSAVQRRFLKNVLKRAAAFQKALWSGDLREERERVMYIVLGSDANDTLEKALLQQTQSGWSTRSNPHDDTIYNKAYVPGDGTVTRKSLLGTHDLNGNKYELPSAYEIFFTQHHMDLMSDPTFMDNVLHSLLDKTE